MLFGCSWYEGAVTAGYSSDEVDDAVQASIVAAGWLLPGATRLKSDEADVRAKSNETAANSGATAPGTAIMYGVSHANSLVTIDLLSGKFHELTPPNPAIVEQQEISAIDRKLQRYYTLGLNHSTFQVTLFVWALDGHSLQGIPLPLQRLPILGAGEAIDVDPNDSSIIVMGHDPKRGHHSIFTVDPRTFSLTFVADVGGDARADVLVSTTAYDSHARTVYVKLAYYDTKARGEEVKFVAVSLSTGRVITLDWRHLAMDTISYDITTKRIYGTIVTRPAPTKRIRSLAYFDTGSLSSPPTVVATLEFADLVGELHAFDGHTRTLYLLLLTDYCTYKYVSCAQWVT